MATLLPEEAAAKEILERLLLTVTPIPTGKAKTAEFLVDGDGRGYAMEVKARRDSEDWKNSLKNRKVAYQERSMGYGPWTKDVARTARKQILAVDQEHTRWWVLWLSIECRASTDTMFAQVVGSLFGVRQVVYYDPTSTAWQRKVSLLQKTWVR